MVALSAHVSMLRAKTNISIGDGGNTSLALRIRRHGNFIENVPMALLLMALAELLGTGSLWLHAAGLLLLVGRLFHALGLNVTQPASPLRIAGGSMTTLATLIAAGNILAHLIAT
ncbi:MAG: MAPEG family protein [Hyphomicrobiales bacterium]